MTKPSQAIELVSNIEDENSSDLLLCGIDGIQYANLQFSTAHYYNTINSDNSVSNVFGLGENNKFFYTLLSFRDNEIIRYECGTGYGYEKDNKHYFKRYLPLYEGKNSQHRKLIKKPYSSKFYCIHDAVNVLTSFVPEDYAFIFYDPNCVLCSKDAATPLAIQILNNSFLARVNDNDIANLSFDSKEFSDITAESLTKYTKQIALKCSRLTTNKLSVKHLQLDHDDGAGAKAGTFIYDSESDTVKFYNGTIWRTLKWADEEKAE